MGRCLRCNHSVFQSYLARFSEPQNLNVTELADSKPSLQAAESMLFAYAHNNFAIPGEVGFVLGGLTTSPANPEEAGLIVSSTS